MMSILYRSAGRLTDLVIALANSTVLPLRQPSQEQTVRRDVFPIRNRAARYLGEMPPEQLLQFLSPEPLLPLGSFQPAPLFRVFVDNYDAPAGPNHAADFGDGYVDLNRMFERLGGVGAIKS